MSADDCQADRAPVAALRALATRALDEGAYDRVLPLFEAARRQGLSAAEGEAWARILLEAGEFNTVADIAAPRRQEPVAAGAQVDPAPTGDGDFLEFEPGERQTAAPEPAAPLVAIFLRFFAGRADVYARQWYDARRDQCGYWPVHESLTPRVVQDHLLGRITVGQYVLHPDETVSFAALDLDPKGEALEQILVAGEAPTALSYPPLTEYARRILDAAIDRGLTPVAEDTGGVGLHVWIFFAPRISAGRARALLREILWRAGPQPPAVTVELFPKQDKLSGKGLGNLVKLPLGVHQASGRASSFVDRELHPIPAEAALTALAPSDPAAIDRILASRVIALETAGARSSRGEQKPEPSLRLPAGPTPRDLGEALAMIPAGREANAAADRILEGCAILRELVRQGHEERSLPADAARALLYTVGLVSRDNDRIEELFANASISRKELDRVRRGLQSPAGCKRLRERFPALASRCSCPDPPEGGYATPALFALREPPRFERKSPPCPGTSDAVLECAPPDVEGRLARIEAALEKLAAREEE